MNIHALFVTSWAVCTLSPAIKLFPLNVQVGHNDIHGRWVSLGDFEPHFRDMHRRVTIYLTTTCRTKWAGFGESIMVLLNLDMEDVVDELGFSVWTGIGAFGAAMFEIVIDQHCRFNLLQDRKYGDPFKWPKRDSLTATDGGETLWSVAGLKARLYLWRNRRRN